MTATISHTPTRRSRIAFPFSNSSSKYKHQKEEDEDSDWYIPYNGPIEAPPQQPTRDWAEDYRDANVNRQRSVSLASGNGDARQSFGSGRGGARPYNYINLDNAGGVGDVPVPSSSGMNSRQHKEKSFDRERGREREDSGPGNRMSIVASIFGFGNSHVYDERGDSRAKRGSGAKRERESIRKMPSWSAFSKTPTPSKRPSSPSHPPSSTSTRRSRPGRTGLNLSLRAPSTIGSSGGGQGQAANSTATSEEEYYNSYYSTLLQSPSSPSSPSPSSGRDTVSPHPYVYAANIPEEDEGYPYQREPRTAPHLTFSHTPAVGEPLETDSLPTSLKGHLKNSISTPNLRSPYRPMASTSASNHLQPPRSSNQPLPRPHKPPPPSSVPKGMDRWLSAETWCDALLFPRPRLRVRRDGDESSKSSAPSSSAGLDGKWKGRIVSPPGTPLREDFRDEEPATGVVSRVLAYSRSLVDLNASNKDEEQEKVGWKGKGRSRAMTSSAECAEKRKPREKDKGKGKAKEKEREEADPMERTLNLRPPRPLSWAQDDLALPSPVPSLAKVLEDIQNLETQRREWQLQATHSLGNKAARSLSRARSKSLTAKGAVAPRNQDPIPTIDFLAARACLGGQQDFVKVVDKGDATIRSKGINAAGQGTISSKGHSHSSSLVKTLSRSSKSYSRNHSRNDSWSKSALRAAKGAATMCFGSDVEAADGAGIEGQDNVDNGSGRRETYSPDQGRVIKVADPVDLPVPRAGPGSGGVSPTPSSAISDSRVGIAISTPPVVLTDGRGELKMPAHPYAQGGAFSYVQRDDRGHHNTDSYAGPHPVVLPRVPGDLPDIAMRHKLPPHIVLHPYAHGSNASSPRLISQSRPESDVPAPAKMWAQLSPGVVREVLPNELGNYSPYMSENGDADIVNEAQNELRSLRESTYITDTAGLGKALAYAVRQRESKDSGLGTSEEQAGLQGLGMIANRYVEQAEDEEEVEESPEIAQRIHNARYDARPAFLKSSKMHSDLSTNHTFSSSPLILTPNTRMGPFGLETVTPSPGDTSGTSSSQHSPRPLGSPNDLEHFQDLFYKPTSPKNTKDDDDQASIQQIPPQAWPLASPHRRTGSGLTTLARQLSEELEQMAIERERSRSISQYSRDSAVPSIGGRSGLSRRPTEDGLEFVLEEAPRSESPAALPEIFDGRHVPISAFQPSGTLPEDVDSRASSPIEKTEEDEDQTARFRVGMVESVSTPPATFSNHHLSMTADMTFTPERHLQHLQHENSSRTDTRTSSGLHPPLIDAARSSYMTNSTMSRMSNLSDFPAPPPKDFAGQRHMSLLSAFFNDAITESDIRASTPPLPSDDRRLTFGVNEDAEALLALLSSSPPQASTSNSNS